MQTRLFSENNDIDCIKDAAEILARGELLAFPTETVYGLGASMLFPDSIKKIFEVKGRPQDNPLILHLFGPEQLQSCAENIPNSAYLLAEKFWPGPLTMILPKRSCVPVEVSAGLSTVGVRCPAKRITREIIKKCGAPVAAPSANISGRPSPTNAQHVFHDLNGKISGIVDGGECEVGVESTIIDLTSDPPKLLRPGGITISQLEEILGPIDIDPAVYRLLNEGEQPKAPGMKYRHYAPKADLVIINGDVSAAADYISGYSAGIKAVLCYDEEESAFSQVSSKVKTYGKSDNPSELANRLFSKLREFDEENIDIIFARCPEGTGLELAVQNRLNKAAGYKIINV